MKSIQLGNVSDRAEPTYRVPVLDGILGDEMDVVATKEGLELGGYAIVPWPWIIAALRTVWPATYVTPPASPDSGTPCGEDGGRS